MSPRRLAGLRFWIAAALLAAVFLAQSFSASRLKSPVFDEPAHIAAGLSYLGTGAFVANLQHPPLLKELAAVSLELGGIHWPDTAAAQQLAAGTAGLEWGIGNDLIAQNPGRVLFWARLPFILLTAGLGLLIAVWGRELFGDLAGLGALFLFAFDPNIVAHSFLVATDMGFAAFAVLFFYSVWRYLQVPSMPRVGFAGVCLGLMLGAKFSAIFLLPVAGVMWGMPPGLPKRPGGSAVLHLAIMGAIAAVVVQALYFSPAGLFLYANGLSQVNVDHAPNHLVFLAGALRHHFLSYFAAAYLLKEPIPILVLTAAGLLVVLRTGKFFLLLPPIVLFIVYSIWADDLGFRYLMPALPFLYLMAGAALAQLVEAPSALKRALAAVLCIWTIAGAARIYPDHLAYFNEAACIKPGCGIAWMDDSNVDWGQGLPQLKVWLDEHAPGRPVTLGYFGSFPPENYGIHGPLLDEPDLMRDPVPGLYAVSAHFVARVPAMGGSQWLRQPPAAIVGHSIYIFDIPRQGVR